MLIQEKRLGIHKHGRNLPKTRRPLEAFWFLDHC